MASFIVPLVCYGFLYGTLMYHGLLYSTPCVLWLSLQHPDVHGLPYDTMVSGDLSIDTMVSGDLSIFSGAPKLGRSCYMTLDCHVYICKQVLEGTNNSHIFYGVEVKGYARGLWPPLMVGTLVWHPQCGCGHPWCGCDGVTFMTPMCASCTAHPSPTTH